MSKVTVSELGPTELEKLNNMLKEDVVAQIAISQQKEQRKSIREIAKDELDLSTTEFNKYAKIAYENHKAQEILDQAEELYENCVRLGLIQSIESND